MTDRELIELTARGMRILPCDLAQVEDELAETARVEEDSVEPASLPRSLRDDPLRKRHVA